MIAHERLALRHRFVPTLLRPPHPRPTFVTMANAPLLGPGWGELVALICPTTQAIFRIFRIMRRSCIAVRAKQCVAIYFPAEMVFSSKAFGKLAKANDVKRCVANG